MAPACHRPPYRYYQITSFYLLEVKASHIGQCFKNLPTKKVSINEAEVLKVFLVSELYIVSKKSERQKYSSFNIHVLNVLTVLTVKC